MRKMLLFWLVMLFCGFVQAEKAATVYQVDIADEIGPKVWRLAKKSFDEASRMNADYVVIRMNTYGGMVIYADSLRSLILNYPRPVLVYVDNNAASAGALIAIACDKIYMREGANIGAATVVNETGEAMPDKYQSYMRSMIRSTAQAHGRDTLVDGQDTIVRWKRDPRIAEAMVDESLQVDGVSEKGKVVTFTAHEAMKYGYCDGIAECIEEVLQKENIGDYTLMSYKETTIDVIIGFLINPVVRGILIMLIIGGIYFEFQTPGIGLPLAIAILGCLLYFAPLYLEGIAAGWEIVLFVVGVLLIALEIFVIPGFGVTGISGIVCVVVGLVVASVDHFSWDFPQGIGSAVLMSTAIVLCSISIGIGVCLWFGAKLILTPKRSFALHAEQKKEDGYVGVDISLERFINYEASVETTLRPSGKIRIGSDILDAVSENGEFLTSGTRVKVVRFQTGQLYVVKA